MATKVNQNTSEMRGAGRDLANATTFGMLKAACRKLFRAVKRTRERQDNLRSRLRKLEIEVQNLKGNK